MLDHGHNLNTSLVTAADEIVKEHQELLVLIEDTEAKAKRIGNLLVALKPTLKSASVSISDFCKDYLPFSKSAAYEYMAIAQGKTTLAQETVRKNNSASAENTDEPNDPKLKQLANKIRGQLDEINASEVGRNMLNSTLPGHWVENENFIDLMPLYFGALQEAACARRHNNLSDYEEVEKTLRKIEAALGVTESQITSFVDTHNDERKLNKYWCSVWALVDAETKDEKERNKQTLFAMVHMNSTIEQLAIKAVGDLKVMWLCIDLRLTKICLDNRWTYEEPQRTGSNLDNDTAIIKDLCDQHTPEVVLEALRGGEATAFPNAEKRAALTDLS